MSVLSRMVMQRKITKTGACLVWGWISPDPHNVGGTVMGYLWMSKIFVDEWQRQETIEFAVDSLVWKKTKVGSQNFSHQQSWPLVHGLLKLVASTSFQFQYLVNTTSVLVKWIPIRVVYCWPIGIGSIWLWLALTYGAQWNFTSNDVGHFSQLIGAHNLKA